MIPLGYMAKRILEPPPDWLGAPGVTEICSVTNCYSANFVDGGQQVREWKHNGWWFYDRPAHILAVAQSLELDLSGMTLFYYEAYPEEYDGIDSWHPLPGPDTRSGMTVDVAPPTAATLLGYDIVCFSCESGPECSPLFCNGLAREAPVNPHCLLDNLDAARSLLASGFFENSEPGPYRILAVHRVGSPLPVRELRNWSTYWPTDGGGPSGWADPGA